MMACVSKRPIGITDYCPLTSGDMMHKPKRSFFIPLEMESEISKDSKVDYIDLESDIISKTPPPLQTTAKQISNSPPPKIENSESLKENFQKKVETPKKVIQFKLLVENKFPSSPFKETIDFEISELKQTELWDKIQQEACHLHRPQKFDDILDLLIRKKIIQILNDEVPLNSSEVEFLKDCLLKDHTVSKEDLENCKLFTLNEVASICNEGWKKREVQLKHCFDSKIKNLLAEQHAAIVKFYREAFKQCPDKTTISITPSYIS